MKVRFADCTLDFGSRQLFRAGREMHVSPKAFELLRALVDEQGRALSKAELLERVWPGVFVSEASLARVVSEIRDAIGDGRDTPIIRTVHAYGYAFNAAFEHVEPHQGAAPAVARCWMICRERSVPLPDGEHIVGRDTGLSVWLDSPKVSRRHARMVVRGTEATIEDLGSKNGTIVRGARIVAPLRLESGDEIQVGPYTLTFRVVGGQGSTETEVRSR